MHPSQPPAVTDYSWFRYEVLHQLHTQTSISLHTPVRTIHDLILARNSEAEAKHIHQCHNSFPLFPQTLLPNTKQDSTPEHSMYFIQISGHHGIDIESNMSIKYKFALTPIMR